MSGEFDWEKESHTADGGFDWEKESHPADSGEAGGTPSVAGFGHGLQQGLSFGHAHEIEAGITSGLDKLAQSGPMKFLNRLGRPDAKDSEPTSYDAELAKANQRGEAVDNAAPAASLAGNIVGSLPGAIGLNAAGQGATAALRGGANVLTRVAGSALGGATSSVLSGQNPLVGAAMGGGGQAVGEGVSAASSAIARRFPGLADRLASTLTGQKPEEVAWRALNTAKGNFPAGDYANEVTRLGLVKPTSEGTMNAGVRAAQKAGAELGSLRADKTVRVADVEKILDSGISGSPEFTKQSLTDFRNALPQPPKPPPAAVAVDPAEVARQSDLAKIAKTLGLDVNDPRIAQIAAKGGMAPRPVPVPNTNAEIDTRAINLKELSELQKLHVGESLATARNANLQGNGHPANQRILGSTNDALNDMQRGMMKDPAQYDALRKTFAISENAGKGAARQLGKAAVGAGIGGYVGYHTAGIPGAFAGAAVGVNPKRAAAYAALRGYNALRSPGLQTAAKAMGGKLGVGAAKIMHNAAASGDPVQAGAAVQKIQANDPQAREKLKNEEED